MCKQINEDYIEPSPVSEYRRNAPSDSVKTFTYHGFVGDITPQPSAMEIKFQYASDMLNSTACQVGTEQLGRHVDGANATFTCGCPDGFDLVINLTSGIKLQFFCYRSTMHVTK